MGVQRAFPYGRLLLVLLVAIGLLYSAKLLVREAYIVAFQHEIESTKALPARIALYEGLLRTLGATRAQDTLAKTLPANGVSHVIAHEAGTFLYETAGPRGIAQCEPSFADACYHGFIAAMARDVGLGGIAALDVACEAALNGDSVNRCSHGIGHALLDIAGIDNLPKGIALCKQVFASDTKATNFCADGVFMEAKFKGGSSEMYDPSDPMYPCDQTWVIDAGVHDRCWIAQSQRTLQSAYESRFHGDVASVGAYCATLSGMDRVNCYWGIELQIIFMAHTPAAQQAMCAQLGDGTDENNLPLAKSCYLRILQAEYQFGDHDALPAACAIETDPRMQNECYRTIAIAIANSFSDPALRIASCKALPAGRVDACTTWVKTASPALY